MALIAMLATADDGERTREWLRGRLWGSRGDKQAQGSLRTTLTTLRDVLEDASLALLASDEDRVWLQLDNIQVDARAPLTSADASGFARREFLEGFYIAGEEGFDDWLRDQRDALASAPVAAAPLQPARPLPAHIVDVSQPAPGFAGQPALAVLPFLNQTGDPENSYLAEGLSEDLIDRVSRLRWLPVIARGSSFMFRGEAVDHAAVGQQLGAKYLFEGRMRRVGQGLSLAVELTEAATRRVLWSDRLEERQILTREGRDDVVIQLVGALDTRIDAAEQLRARIEPDADLTVSRLIWKGRWHIDRLTKEDAERARVLFARALELEPESAEALIQSAWALGRSIWAERRNEDHIAELRHLAWRAIRVAPEDSRGHWLAGVAEMWLRRPERAKALLKRAIGLNPSLAEAHSVLGDTYCWSGEPGLALDSLRFALRLSPTDHMIFAILSNMATAYWMLGKWAEAVDAADQSIMRRPGFWFSHTVKIAALMDQGDTTASARAYRDLLVAKPGFDPVAVDWVAFMDRNWNARLRRSLAQAALLAETRHS
jgi:TolB-like protein/cytochrome c-type biogenesis protein CcmH/NrfG